MINRPLDLEDSLFNIGINISYTLTSKGEIIIIVNNII